MISLELICMGSFDSEFQNKKYKIYQFIDPKSLVVINGANLKGSYEPGQCYKMKCVLKGNKLKVTE